MAEVKNLVSDMPRVGNTTTGTNFIRAIIENDLRNNKGGGRIVTRFPPEPNGYLHIGHAKAICLDFGLARDYQGYCNLRFDDTNPATEDLEYVDSIKNDIRWLGFDWGDREFYASDYFEDLYGYALHLIKAGNAYVDSLNEDSIRTYRGTVTEPGRESPYRTRGIDENLDLFEGMKAGEFRDGEHVLRAKIDMASANMKMRDPLLYRIRHAHHYRKGDDWCIYPMYDFAHPLSDAIEGITHSLCTLEFDNNRELYDWVLENTVGEPRPHQYEFARLNLDYTVTSKRKLLNLVRERYVSGWDDPRMPTLAGLRRRGVTPESIRSFCDLIGIAKAENRVDISLLEHTIRDDLNFRAPRVMCVLDPLRVVITNFPKNDVKWLDAPYWPHDVPREGSRKVPFSREIYIDRDDFREDPPKGYYRLSPGKEVRLRYAYLITCEEVVRDDSGKVTELRCTYDPATRGGKAPDGRKVRGTIHWVSASHALPVEVRLYDRLFTTANPDDGGEALDALLNPHSLVIHTESMIEPSVAEDPEDTRYQFEREGYFWRDPIDSRDGLLVFNRVIPLRDTWGKVKVLREKAPKRRESKAAPTTPSTAERAGELKGTARDRFTKFSEMGLDDDDAVILAENVDAADFFDDVLVHYASPRTISRWVVNELLRELKERAIEELKFTPEQFADLVKLTDEEVISGRVAKEVFSEMLLAGGDPAVIVEQRNLERVSDPDELSPAVEAVINSFTEKVQEYRGGKTGLLGFFVGQVIRQTGGKADPRLVREMVEDRLNG